MLRNYDYVDITRSNVDLRNKNVWIWGIGYTALQLFMELKDLGAFVKGFTDSFTNKTGVYAGLPLVPYTDISKIENNPFYLYIATWSYLWKAQIMETVPKMEKCKGVLCRGKVYGPEEYDTKMMGVLQDSNKEKIEYVKQNLQDEKSLKTFENILRYRVSNNPRLIWEIFEKDNPQYFEKDFVKCGNHEIFVEAGGYDGSSSIAFSKFVKGKYNKIYIMEPDETMYYVAYEMLKHDCLHDFEIHKKGAFSKKGTVRFTDDFFAGSSRISDDGNFSIETISIDEMLGGSPATFIKMDIEGAEQEALIGCRNTINRYHPILAISIYHKINDLWNILYDLMKRCTGYKFYMRHYTTYTTETILYAV